MFKLHVDHDNAAFDQDLIYPEIARILRYVADRLDAGELSIYDDPDVYLFDSNGNRVGKAEFVEE